MFEEIAGAGATWLLSPSSHDTMNHWPLPICAHRRVDYGDQSVGLLFLMQWIVSYMYSTGEWDKKDASRREFVRNGDNL